MTDLDTLNELLGELENIPDERVQYLREHLEGARYYVTGAMPAELELNLELAKQSLDALADPALKLRVQHFIDEHRRKERS